MPKLKIITKEMTFKTCQLVITNLNSLLLIFKRNHLSHLLLVTAQKFQCIKRILLLKLILFTVYDA